MSIADVHSVPNLQLLLHKVLDAVVVMRRDGTVADWNRCAEMIFGWSRSEAIGRPMGEMIVPDRYRIAHDEGLRRYLDTGEGPVLDRRIEITAINRSGREFPVELTITVTDYSGEQVFLGFLRDISDRKEAERALAESEARLQATYDHAPVGIGEVAEDGRFLRANEQFSQITGYALEELRQLSFLAITHPDDVEEDVRLFGSLWRGEIDGYTREKRYVTKDGTIVWIELAASIVRGGAGARSFSVRIVRDISERRRAEEHQALLLNELNHRVKNTLAIVQSLAQQSFKGIAVPQEPIAAFEGRLGALSAAHDLLTQGNWEAASIRSIISAALLPFQCSDSSVAMAGPDVLLPPQTSVSLALAVHELATNAAKYGALSLPSGQVNIQWEIVEDRLKWKWIECGGPPVSLPTSRGFGTRMIERALAAELSGNVKIDFLPSGVACLLEAPLPRLDGDGMSSSRT